MKRALLLVTLFFLPAFHAPAQVLQSRRYTVKDGLPHANVYRIFQDSRGFIWFCTEFGASRFDGKTFRNEAFDVYKNPAVMSMQEYGGEKWFCLYGSGLCILAGDSLRKPEVTTGVMPASPAYSLHDKAGNVWIITIHGELFRLSGKTIVPVLPGVRFRKMTQLRDESIVFTSDDGLFRSTGQGLFPFLRDELGGAAYDFCETAGNDYWVTTPGKILHLVDRRVAEAFETKAPGITADFMVAADGSAWYCSPSSGVLRVADGVLQNYTARLGLTGKIVNDLFCDREGNIWLGSHGDGVLCLYSPHVLRFPVEQQKIGLYAHGLASWKDGAVIASIGTVSVYSDKTLRPLHLELVNPEEYLYYAATDSAYIYVGTPLKTIIYDPANGREDSTQFGSLCWHRDARGQTWLGSYHCAAKLARRGNKWHADTISFQRKRRVNAITSDDAGNVWMGTDSGLYVYRNERLARAHGLPDSMRYIKALLYDSQQRLWAATAHGLALYVNDAWKIFSEAGGLSHSRCHALAEDPDGNIWIGTMRGLDCARGRGADVELRSPFTFRDEILSVLITGRTLWMGTVNGVISAALQSGERSLPPPEVYILSATAGPRRVPEPSAVSLDYSDRRLALQFVSPAFHSPDRVEYRYRIAGLSDSWIVTTQHALEFPSLPSGSYTFTVQARQEHGAWGAPATMTIHVKTPFWLTWWFISGCSVLSVALVLLGSRRYFLGKIRQEKEAAAITNKMLHLRQQALTAMINPHFIFNCLNSIQYFINRKDIRGSEDYLERFATLVRLTIEDTREVAIGLEREVRRLRLYLGLEQLRFGDKLNYTFEIDPAAEQVMLPNMIVQPYVENALLHGIGPKKGQGHLIIRATLKSPGILMIEVEDDGVGFSHAKKQSTRQHHSLGMAIIRERLDLMSRMNGQEFFAEITERKNEAGEAIGTLVRLHIPVETLVMS